MPVLAKILSDDDERLQLAQVDEIDPQYIQDFGNQEELDSVIFRLFQPHAYAARLAYEEKKEQRMNREKWLETIVNSHNNMRSLQDITKQQILLKKQQSGSNANLVR